MNRENTKKYRWRPNVRVAQEGAPEQRRSRLTEISNFINLLSSIVLKTSLLAVFFLLGLEIYSQSNTQSIVIASIHSPQSLVENGYTEEVFRNAIGERIRTINRSSTTYMPAMMMRSIDDAALDVQIPSTGISYRLLAKYVKDSFGTKDITIKAEVVQDKSRYSMRIYIDGSVAHGEPLVASGRNVEELIDASARLAVHAISPVTLANYLIDTEEIKCRERGSCDFSDALAELQSAISTPPASDDKWAMNMNGYVLAIELNRPGDSIEFFTRAIELDPGFVVATGNLGVALHKTGDYQGAIEQFRNVIALENKSACEKLRFGWFQRNCKPPFAQRLTDDSLFAAEAYHHWADSAKELKDEKAALEKYEVAISKYKNLIEIGSEVESDVYGQLGDAFSGAGKYEEAILQYKRAVALNPAFGSAHYGWGNALRMLGRNNEAIVEYKKAIAIYPLSIDAHEGWAKALENLHEEASAQKKYRLVERYRLERDRLGARNMAGPY